MKLSSRYGRAFRRAEEQTPGFVRKRKRMPLSRAEQLKSLMDLFSVYHHVETSGIAYLGLGLNCTWESEHGLGVMRHKNRVVRLGGADTAILAWIAEQDAAGKTKPKR